MASTVSSPVVSEELTGEGSPGSKGLKTGALGMAENVVIGVASTAPAYSLAVSLGLVAAAVGLASPSIMWVAFIPMFCIAMAYYYMNRADPDCGTSFTWVTTAVGPHMGWFTGWVMIVAQVIVIASLAEVAAQYTFSLFGIDVFADPVIPIQVGEVTFDLGVVGLGVLFVAAMTWICWRGIELSARSQAVLLTVELVTLATFAIVALVKVFGGLEGSVMPTLEWLNPLSIVGEDGGWDSSAFAAALLVTLFIYWGWDTTASVNEESGNPTEQPGRATIYSVLILVGTYLLVTIAAQAIHGAEYLAEQGESDILASLGAEILGEPLNVLLILAVLTSAAASTQTTILPCARTALSMGAKGAAPKYWAQVHPRYLTPANATIWTGILAVLWYIGLKLISENVYWDALTALGLMIAFYYGITGYASVIYYRKVLFRSVKDFVGMGLLPLFGAVVLTWAFWQSVIDLMSPLSSYTCTDAEDVTTCANLFGIGVPLALSILLGILGVILLVAWRLKAPEFFQRKREVFQPEPEVAA